jgi:hypothetical protein
LRVEVEDPRRIDQRRDEDRRRSAAAMVAQACAANARDFRLRRLALRPLGNFVSTQAGKRVPGQSSVIGGRLANKIEEEGQGPGRPLSGVPMLQRTMFRE